VGADTPRLLHRCSQYGYTSDPSRALFAEPEAISAEAQAALALATSRRERDAQLAEWNQRKAAIERELAWLHSQRFHRDVRSSVRALQRQVDQLDRKIAR
jgi:hypothetical protein